MAGGKRRLRLQHWCHDPFMHACGYVALFQLAPIHIRHQNDPTPDSCLPRIQPSIALGRVLLPLGCGAACATMLRAFRQCAWPVLAETRDRFGGNQCRSLSSICSQHGHSLMPQVDLVRTGTMIMIRGRIACRTWLASAPHAIWVLSQPATIHRPARHGTRNLA